MKKRTALLITALILTGCQATSESMKESKTETVQQTQDQAVEKTKAYTYEEYKQMFEEAVSEMKSFDTEEEALQKWIIRTVYDAKLAGRTGLSRDEVLAQAKEEMEKRNAWINYAKEEYGVEISQEEVDRYIEEGPDQVEVPQQKAAAEAIGMTPKEFNHTFDRDHYELAVLFEKLLPTLREEYDVSGNQNLIERYKEEVHKEWKA